MHSRSVLMVAVMLCVILAPAAALQAAADMSRTAAATVSAPNRASDDTSIRNLPATRASVAMTLARLMAGGDDAVPQGPIRASFTDVPTSHWAFKYVEYMKANNIMFDYPDGSLRLSEVMTRGQVAVIIARLLEQDEERIPDGPALPSFADVPIDSAWYRFVEYAYARGIFGGYSDGLFHPEYLCTRGDFADILERALKPTTVESEMIGSNPRMSVVYECWFALRRSYLSTPNSEGPRGGLSIGGMTVSDWNYLNSDGNAINVIKGIYGSNVSRCASGYSCYSGYYYGRTGGYGRGGQCVSFAATILLRSRNYRLYWTWANTRPCNYSSARYAQPGDLIFRKTGIWHVAIVVQNLGYGLDVVDSNWVGYGSYRVRSGYSDSEIIGRHPYTWSQLDSGCWKRYSGQGKWY